MSRKETLRFLTEIVDDPAFISTTSKFKKGSTDDEWLTLGSRLPKELSISGLYQRLISPSAITKYKQFNKSLATIVVVSIRPKYMGGEITVIDGQHTAVMALLSGEDLRLVTLELHHKENATKDEVVISEAKLFEALNTQRKNPSKLDEYRAGLVFGDPEALLFEKVLKACNLKIDGLGDEYGDDIATATGSRFIKTVQQYGEDYLGHIVKSVKLMRDLWNPADFRDDMIHGLTTLLVFLDIGKDQGGKGLNGKKDKVQFWIQKEMGKLSIRKYYHNSAGGNTHYKIVHNVMREYNYWAELNAPNFTITADFLHNNGIHDPDRIMTDAERASLPKFPW
jgi:hypothetical protein